MSENNINGYANEQTTLSDSDWFDIDAYLGVDDYESRKVSFGTIKNQILNQTSNIYNSNGTLTGNRTINCDSNFFGVQNAIVWSISAVNGNAISSNGDLLSVTSGATNLADKHIKYTNNYYRDWDNTTSYEALVPLGFVVANGNTANRPTQGITGQTYFDTDLGYQITWDGTNWVASNPSGGGSGFIRPYFETGLSGGGNYDLTADKNGYIIQANPSSNASIKLPGVSGAEPALGTSDKGFYVTFVNTNDFVGGFYVQYGNSIFDSWDVDPLGNLTILWTGTNWQVLASNNTGQQPTLKSGTTANRPINGLKGLRYFDTDLGYPIWFNGTNWVNATGQVV